jgi:hypothetical protein
MQKSRGDWRWRLGGRMKMGSRWRKRVISIDGDVAYVPLTRGFIATIDANDASLLSDKNWCAKQDKNNVYAISKHVCNGVEHTIYMHRVLMDAKSGEQVDHKNGNGLDNRRENLRIATHAQNMRNQGVRINNSTGFKGVSFLKESGKWRARIHSNGKKIELGSYSTPEAAADAYKKASEQLHGEFSRTHADTAAKAVALAVIKHHEGSKTND